MQEFLNGPHTRVRVDAVATPSAPASSPQGKRKGRGARQMGLTRFYRGAPCDIACATNLIAVKGGHC